MSERDVAGSGRRERIVEAATRVIVREGMQGASLSEIEREAGVSRGVLTHYFPAKEDLILAVFDATLAGLERRMPAARAEGLSGWAAAERVFAYMLTEKPRDDPFDCLHYAFLAQMTHRPDFRTRLAAQHADARDHVAADLAEEVRRGGFPPCDVEAVATVVMGAMHGLIMQLNVDPTLDGRRPLEILEAMLRGYLSRADHQTTETAGPPADRGASPEPGPGGESRPGRADGDISR